MSTSSEVSTLDLLPLEIWYLVFQKLSLEELMSICYQVSKGFQKAVLSSIHELNLENERRKSKRFVSSLFGTAKKYRLRIPIRTLILGNSNLLRYIPEYVGPKLRVLQFCSTYTDINDIKEFLPICENLESLKFEGYSTKWTSRLAIMLPKKLKELSIKCRFIEFQEFFNVDLLNLPPTIEKLYFNNIGLWNTRMKLTNLRSIHLAADNLPNEYVSKLPSSLREMTLSGPSLTPVPLPTQITKLVLKNPVFFEVSYLSELTQLKSLCLLFEDPPRFHSGSVPPNFLLSLEECTLDHRRLNVNGFIKRFIPKTTKKIIVHHDCPLAESVTKDFQIVRVSRGYFESL